MNVAVLIPAYNAAGSLPQLLERTRRFVASDAIMVVNDGSTDGTKVAAERFGIHLLSHETNQGKGAALQTGFEYVLGNRFDAVITMDADLQHKPEDIPRFLELYSLRRYDVIIGNRMHHPKGMPIHRLFSNRMTTFLVNARTGANISDSQSGFRLITAKVLERVRLSAKGFEAETEFLIKAASCGCTFGSLPIDTVYGGERSHMTPLQTTVNFVKVLFKEY